MKKIVVMLTACLIAGLAQAAALNWAASNLEAEYKGQAFYLFDASSKDAVLAALASVDTTTAATLAGMQIYQGTATSKGKASVTALDVGNTTSLMVVLVGGDFADGVAYKYMVEDVSSMLYNPPSPPPGTFASGVVASGTAGTMVKAGGGGDVPEPTSALLLLVGGAMLALRRKQK